MTLGLHVLIVCHQPMFRYGLRTLIEQLDNVEGTTEAGSEQEALSRCGERMPDLVITDLALPGGGTGMRVCRAVKERRGEVPTIVLSSDVSATAVAAALNAGVDSFLHKSATCRQLVEVFEATCSGRRAWVLGDTAPPSVELRHVPGAGLTSREEEILALILKRRSNEEIADGLCLAQQTVKNYVSKVLQKLGFGSRKELYRSVEVSDQVDAVPRPRTRLKHHVPVTCSSSAVL